MLLMTSCIMIDAELQVPDETVKPELTGEDCVPIIFGIGIGTVRMQDALHVGNLEGTQTSLGYVYNKGSDVRIRRVHSIVLQDRAGFLGFGARCVQVTGEP
jgi:hypothetical protein